MNVIQSIPTPFYLYDLDLLEETVRSASDAAHRHQFVLHYAIKANNEPLVCQSVLRHGIGIDCVSGQEIEAAIRYGFPGHAIVFAGVGKSDNEIGFALDNDIFCFNCESVEELSVIAQIAEQKEMVARVALRVNPDVDAQTHQKITTGLNENKFGIHLSQLQSALDCCYASESLEFIGLHFHIGSQIMSGKPFEDLCHSVNRIWREFRIDSYNPKIVNLGGGLGIDYANPSGNPVPDFASFFRIFAENLSLPPHIRVHFELGRSLVGQCATLYSRVLYVKNGVNRKFVILDAGMTELLRPALYQAVHKVENISSNKDNPQRYDVVGPACESSDVFARDLNLPETNRGDLIAIYSCGAYVQSMSLHYNLRPRASANFLQNGKLLKESLSDELLHASIV